MELQEISQKLNKGHEIHGIHGNEHKAFPEPLWLRLRPAERPRVIHSESNLSCCRRRCRRRCRDQLVICSTLRSPLPPFPPSQGTSSPNPKPRMGFRRGSDVT